jgi:uncharacterized protein (TIGR03437 family)
MRIVAFIKAVLLASMSIGLGAGQPQALTYNAVTAFSLSNNPNGVWSYLSGGSLLSTSVIGIGSTAGWNYWWDGKAVPNSADIGANVSGNTLTISNSIVMPTNVLQMDPEAASNVTVRFTAPAAGAYAIIGNFLGIDTNQKLHSVVIMHNGVAIFTNTISAFNQNDAFNLTATLSAGDFIDFVSDTGPSAYEDLSTGLSVTITTSAAQNTVTTVSAADYASTVAPDSIVTLFASNLAAGTFVAPNPPPAPLPTSLGGVSATVTDSSGNTLPVSLIAVTPGQVNAVLPSGLQSGVGTVKLTTSTGVLVKGSIDIEVVAPSLFTADQTGGWLAAAQVVIAHADGSQTSMSSIANCGTNLVWNGTTWSTCTPIPINLGSTTDQAVLELFGTGIRNVYAEMAAICPNCGYGVDAFIGNPCNTLCTQIYLPILYAGPQGGGGSSSFYGLDQINISIPHFYAGSGVVQISVEVPSYMYGVWMVAPINLVSLDIQ